jgi:hypothetical protein
MQNVSTVTTARKRDSMIATWTGGTSGAGVAFKLSTGLPPFVETVPTSGCVGNVVVVLGTDLTSASSVTFNGTQATFTQQHRLCGALPR